MLLLLILFAISLFFRRKNAPHAGDFGFGMAVALAVLICGLMLSARLSCFSAGCVLPFVLCSFILFDFFAHDCKEKLRFLGEWLKTHWRPVALSVAVFAFLYYLNAARDLLPRGIDCVHHTILAQKILLTDTLAENWLPFDTTAVNYPQGIHVILAMIAAILRCSIPRAEQIFQMALVVPSALLIGALSARLFRSKVAGWHAALVYVLLGGAGTFYDLWVWAGYPSMAGFLFLLALIWYAGLPKPRLSEHCAAVILWCAFALAHHMTLFIALLLIPGWALLLLMRRTPALKRFLLRYLISGIVAVPLAVAIFPAYFRWKDSGETFHLTSDPMTLWYEVGIKLGLPALLAILGASYGLRAPKEKQIAPGIHFYIVQFLSAFLCFLVTEYLIRFLTARYCGEEFTWFVPTRFLAACSLPLAVLSGGGVLLLQTKFRDRKRGMYLLSTLICLIGVGRFHLQFPAQPQYDDAIRLAEELKQYTPPNAFLLYDSQNLPEPIWVPVLAWRACIIPPIPASENRDNMRRIYWLFAEFENGDSTQLEAIRIFLENRDVVPWSVYIDETGIAHFWALHF